MSGALATVVMAKAPVAGSVKTRLVPALGAAGAAALAARMLRHTVAQAQAAALGPVWLCGAPGADHPAFDAALGAGCGTAFDTGFAAQAGAPAGVTAGAAAAAAAGVPGSAGVAAGGPVPPGPYRMDQGPGDLGERMARAAAARLAGHPAVLIVGTDCPALDAAVLRAAAAALDAHDAVLVPAWDGGYVLVGLRAGRAGLLPALFDGLPWSTPALLEATRQRLAAGGWRHAELPPLADIDEPADLRHLPAGWRD
jgi:glycosyltransferase A (GT-A) superfamily protein (DUF2064 family)